MDKLDYAIKSVTSFVIYLVGLFCAVLIYFVTLLTCFRDGYRNIFSWKDRTSSEPPLHYTSWDAETRKSPNSTSKKWNHAYITVPESGLRFHYVYSGSVPSDIAISEIDGETSHENDNNNIVTNRPKLLILAHGYPECWFTWRYILRYFDKSHPEIGEYFVVALDMRGYGDSDKPSNYALYHRNLLCSDIKGIATTLGYEKFSLMGHDWGGIITYEVAKNFPKSLEKVIVLNGPEVTALQASLTSSPMQMLKSWYVFFFQIPWAADLFVRLSDFNFMTEVITGKISGIQNTNNQLTDEELEMFKYAMRHSTSGPHNYYRALVWPFSEPGPCLQYQKESTEGDPLLETPILIVWGDNDTFMGKSVADMTVKRLNSLNGSKLVTIAKASHWVTQDEPDEVIRHVVDFLRP